MDLNERYLSALAHARGSVSYRRLNENYCRSEAGWTTSEGPRSRGAQWKMTLLVEQFAGVGDRSPDVLRLDLLLPRDFVKAHAASQSSEQSSDGDSCAANNRFAVLNFRINDNSFVHLYYEYRSVRMQASVQCRGPGAAAQAKSRSKLTERIAWLGNPHEGPIQRTNAASDWPALDREVATSSRFYLISGGGVFFRLISALMVGLQIRRVPKVPTQTCTALCEPATSSAGNSVKRTENRNLNSTD
jgi:hypothetical protein